MKFQSTGVLSHDACQLQYNLYCERLVRKNFGEVQKRNFSFKPIDDNTIATALKLVSQIGLNSHCKVVEGGTYTRYCLSDTWACRFAFDVQVGGTGLNSCAESPQRISESEIITDTPIVRVIEVEIYSAKLVFFNQIEQWGKQAGFRIVNGFDVTGGVPVVFAWPTKSGYDYRQQSFDRIPLKNVHDNYSTNVVESVERLLQYAKQVTHGLVVLSGPVGTGKSYLIRSILSEFTQRRAVVCTPATRFLEEAGLLTQVVTNFQKSIIVLEDVGEIISIEAASRYIDARSNLLNFAEGFLSLLTDAIIILSFNYDVAKIDPAVLRPGRCLARIEVKELPYAHAQKLVAFEIPSRSYSLAEVYEMRRLGEPLTAKSSLGFGLP
jgi:hypothetical protein